MIGDGCTLKIHTVKINIICLCRKELHSYEVSGVNFCTSKLLLLPGYSNMAPTAVQAERTEGMCPKGALIQ